MKGTDLMQTKVNITYVLADLLEYNLMEMEETLKKHGLGLRHEAKREFNIALRATRNIRREVRFADMNTQEDYADDSDILNALVMVLIDRIGDDKNMAYNIYEYLKGLPSKIGLDTDYDEVFEFVFKKNGMKLKKLA
jgi:hypothetical protein